MSKIDNECFVCGKKETYNVCIECGTKIFIEGYGGNILGYLEKFNPERLKEILDEYEKEKVE